jgi:hypothetical protein
VTKSKGDLTTVALQDDQVLFEEATSLSKHVDDNFIELGRALRKLQESKPVLFEKVYKTTDLGRRKAYYLVQVSKTFDPAQDSQREVIGGWLDEATNSG